MSDGLPAGLADPLHLMEPWSPSGPLIVGAILCLALFLQWRRVRRGPRSISDTQPGPAATGAQEGLVARIEQLRQEFEGDGDPRLGCHELASLLRQGLAGLRALTVGEIESALGDAGLSVLFRRLERFQFGRRPPQAQDLDTLCELARTAVLNRRRGSA